MIVLFNAPPKAGKSFSCNYLYSLSPEDSFILPMASSIKFYARCLYNIPHDMETIEILEKYKDDKLEIFDGYSPREVYINLSESYFKKFHGEDYFAKMFVKKAKNLKVNNFKNIYVPDLGFQVELDTFVNEFGENEIILVQLTSPNCSFENDSRNYVFSDKVKTICLYNDKSKTSYFYQNLENLYKEYVKKQ